MGKLFKNKLLRTKLENYQIPEFEDKLNVLNNWYKALKNRSLLAKTETQCEQAFNQDFFI